MRDNLVYSTESGRLKPDTAPAPTFSEDGIIRIKRETKGRKGKGMTIIEGVNPLEHDLKKLCKTLKQQCGCGGAVKDQHLEIQGDVRDKAKDFFEKLGFVVKFSGG
jgi:translation initiation factor 1